MRIANVRIGILFVIFFTLLPLAFSPHAIAEVDEFAPKKNIFEVYAGYSRFQEEIMYAGEKLDDVFEATGGDISYYTLGVRGETIISENMFGEAFTIPNVISANVELSGGDNSAVNSLFGFKLSLEYGWLFRLKPRWHLLPYLGISHSLMSADRSTRGMELIAKGSDGSVVSIGDQNANTNRTVTSFLLGLRTKYYLSPNNALSLKGGVLYPEEIRMDIPMLKELGEGKFLYWTFERLKPAPFVEIGFTHKAYTLTLFYNQLRTAYETVTLDNKITDETYGARLNVDIW